TFTRWHIAGTFRPLRYTFNTVQVTHEFPCCRLLIFFLCSNCKHRTASRQTSLFAFPAWRFYRTDVEFRVALNVISLSDSCKQHADITIDETLNPLVPSDV